MNFFTSLINLRKRELHPDARPTKIGTGTFGSVYAAKSAAGGPIVFKRFSITKDTLANFHDEVACHQALRNKGGHPNVLMCLKVYHQLTVGTAEAVMIMEAGLMDLHQLLVSQSYIVPALQACSLVVDVTQGLHYIHSCGIIHRDLKPNNVILCWSLHQNRLLAKVADFGCSRLQGIRLEQTVNFCTCHYRAPEIFEMVQLQKTHAASSTTLKRQAVGSATADSSEQEILVEDISSELKAESNAFEQFGPPSLPEPIARYSFAADVWSLGCIYAEFLHGRLLFHTRSNTDVSLLATMVARLGAPAEDELTIKAWPIDRLSELAKA